MVCDGLFPLKFSETAGAGIAFSFSYSHKYTKQTRNKALNHHNWLRKGVYVKTAAPYSALGLLNGFIRDCKQNTAHVSI